MPEIPITSSADSTSQDLEQNEGDIRHTIIERFAKLRKVSFELVMIAQLFFHERTKLRSPIFGDYFLRIFVVRNSTANAG